MMGPAASSRVCTLCLCAAALLALPACSSDDRGAAGQQCYDNGTCLPGLFCNAGSCSPTGSQGDPCTSSAACTAPLQCVTKTCQATGALNQPCKDGACDPPLACKSGKCVSLGGADQPCRDTSPRCNPGYAPQGSCTCVESGGLGQPCNEDDTCDSASIVCAPTGDKLCVAAGADGQPCRKDGTCDSPLSCLEGTCTKAGGKGEPCRADHTCDSPWLCTSASKCDDAGDDGEPCLLGDKCNGALVCHRSACAAPGGERGPCLAGGTCDGSLTCLTKTNTCVTGKCLSNKCYIPCNAYSNTCSPGFHCRAVFNSSGLNHGHCIRFTSDPSYESWKAGLKPCDQNSDCSTGWKCVSKLCYQHCPLWEDICPASTVNGFESYGPIPWGCEAYDQGDFCAPWTGSGPFQCCDDGCPPFQDQPFCS